MKRPAAVAALALALALPRAAWADPKDDARRHFLEGLDAARAGQYEVALQHFLAAQEQYPHPSTLYNIARAYQDLDDLPNALAYYRLFRDAAPDKAADVTPVIAVIEARLGQRTAPEATAPTAAPATGGGGVSPEVLARMEALAAEFQALTEVLATQPAAPSTPTAPTEPTNPTNPTEPTPPVAPVEPLPDLPQGGFLEEAYQRVVVTASRYGQEPLDSPSAVTIITADDIALSGVQTVPDLLRRAVGVEAMSHAVGQTDISIRGFNRELNNKVLVLVDGRSVYLDFIGTTLWENLPITLEEIERIEIIRGPGSAVYGANAVTGVVNIITRTPGEGKNIVTVDAGSAAYLRGAAVLTGREGPTSWRLSLGGKQFGRWAREYDPATEARDFAEADQDIGLRHLHANGRLDRTFGKSGFASVSGGFDQTKPTEIYNIGVTGDYVVNLDSTYLRGDLAYGPVHLRSFWNRQIGTSLPWSTPADYLRAFDARMHADVVDAELETSQELDTGPVHHRLSGAIGYRYKRTAFTYFLPAPAVEHHVNAFVQEQLTIGPLQIVAAIRGDRHPLIPLQQTLSPRGAAILRVADKTSVRLSGGTAFRNPSHIESYMEWVLPTSTDGVYIVDYGNRSLKPERIVTAEVGLHDESTVYHTFDVAVYMNRLSNIIFLDSVTPVTASATPDLGFDNGFLAGTTGWVNLDPTYLGYGIEAEGELFPIDGLDIQGNVAIQQVREYQPDGSFVQDQSASLVKANGGVTYRSPWRTDLSLHASYVGPQVWRQREFDAAGQIQIQERALDPRLLLSARVGVRPFKDDSVEVAAGVWNLGALIGDADTPGLFGPARENPKGQPVGGRAYGSLTLRF